MDNGWENTPPLRLSLIGFHESSAKTIVHRPESDATTFPLPRTKNVKLYLDAEHGILCRSPGETEGSVSFEGHSLSEHAVGSLDAHYPKSY